MTYVWRMYGVCMAYVWRMYGVCMAYALLNLLTPLVCNMCSNNAAPDVRYLTGLCHNAFPKYQEYQDQNLNS